MMLRHPSPRSRWIATSSPQPTTTTYMGNCKMVEELARMTYHNLHVLSPRDKSAFWTILSKLILQNRDGSRPSRTNNHSKHGQIKEYLNVILVNTLENIGRFNPRALATTALGLAKIVKQVDHVSGKRYHHWKVRIKSCMIYLLGSTQNTNNPYSAKS